MKSLKLFSAIYLLLLYPCFAQEQMPPEKTEVWEPEPTVVIPDAQYGAPSDAILLLKDGLSDWESMDGEEAGWTFENGIVTVKPGAGGIRTKRDFGDIQLHVEWRSPPVTDPGITGQGRGNSGIFLQSTYEVQVLDSYNNRTYSNGQAGSIYKQHIPLANATTAPGTWNVYDIYYTAPRFGEDGELDIPGYVTVVHNGVLIQNHVEIQGTTVYRGYPEYEAHEDRLPLMLQDHGNLVSYRNVWVREL